MNNFYKFSFSFIIITLLCIVGCQKDDTIVEAVESQKSIKARNISLSDIPEVKTFLTNEYNSNFFKSTEIDGAIFDEDNIMEVIDTLQYTNYSFRFRYSDTPIGTFYNLVVGKTSLGELNTPFVLKFISEHNQNRDNLNRYFFKGTVQFYKLTDFFKEGSILKTDLCPSDLDRNGDPIPCEETTLNETDGSGTSTGSSEPNTDSTSDGTNGTGTSEGPSTSGTGDSGVPETGSESDGESTSGSDSDSKDLCLVTFYTPIYENGSNGEPVIVGYTISYGYVKCEVKSLALKDECLGCETTPPGTIGINDNETCPKGQVKNSSGKCVSLDDPCSSENQVRNSKGDCIDDCTKYDDVVDKVLDVEAGYVNDPADPGGATNRGITWAVWKKNAKNILGIEPSLDNLKALTADQAKLIYKPLYWDKVLADDIEDGDLRYMLFDFHVNSGGNAIKVLQRTLNELGENLIVDGAMGSKTVDAINNFDDQINLYNKFKSNRQAYYDNITQRSINRYLAKHSNATETELKKKTFKRFINGWTNRVNHFLNKTVLNSRYVNC